MLCIVKWGEHFSPSYSKKIKLTFIVCALVPIFYLNATTIDTAAHSWATPTQSSKVADTVEGILYTTPEGTYYSPSMGGYSYSYSTPIYNDYTYTYYTSPVGYGYYRPYGSYSRPYYAPYYSPAPYYNAWGWNRSRRWGGKWRDQQRWERYHDKRSRKYEDR